jgi:hypothetical protein
MTVYFCSMSNVQEQVRVQEIKRSRLRSPLGIAGIIMLICGLVLAALMLLLQAAPTRMFYSFTGAGLAFLVINPFVLRTRNSLLWQGLLIGAAAASLYWILS